MADQISQEVMLKSKELFYRGKDLDELKTLDVREVRSEEHTSELQSQR